MKQLTQILLFISFALMITNCGAVGQPIGAERLDKGQIEQPGTDNPANEPKEPNSGNPADPTTPIPEPAPLVFATIKTKVLDKYTCTACHGGARPSARIDLTTYDKLMSDPSLVDLKTDPVETVLVKSISSGDMPPRGPQVSADDLNLLMAWIAAGAKKE